MIAKNWLNGSKSVELAEHEMRAVSGGRDEMPPQTWIIQLGRGGSNNANDDEGEDEECEMYFGNCK